MTIYYKEENRKPLVQAVSEYISSKAFYKKAPTYAYQVGTITVTREGDLELADETGSDEINNLIKFLSDKGFTAKETPKTAEENEVEEVIEETTIKPQSEVVALTMTIPLDKVNIENLTALLKSKEKLIKKALEIEDLEFTVDEEKVSFPWFDTTNNVGTYTNFISALCKMSKEQIRVNSFEKEVTNEKYTFRCFLLRLGFIGDEYKAQRKILLKNLSGSSAFKNGGAKNEISE